MGAGNGKNKRVKAVLSDASVFQNRLEFKPLNQALKREKVDIEEWQEVVDELNRSSLPGTELSFWSSKYYLGEGKEIKWDGRDQADGRDDSEGLIEGTLLGFYLIQGPYHTGIKPVMEIQGEEVIYTVPLKHILIGDAYDYYPESTIALSPRPSTKN